MLKDFLAFAEQNKFSKNHSYLLAVSGGVDSVVMAHLFRAAGYDNCRILHGNFQLRGVHSDQDEAFVRDLAESVGYPVDVKRFHTHTYVKEKRVSVQLAARELRYNWFEKIITEHGFNYLATAHHLDDSLETSLYNLAKGTGIAGLKGISVKNDYIIRPLMFADKEAVLKYATKNNLKWREDSSNRSDKYRRNLIRHKVMPVLKEINPSLLKTFGHTAERIEAAKTQLNELVRGFKKREFKQTGPDLFISKSSLCAQTIFVLDEILKPFGFNYDQVRTVWGSLNQEGLLFESNEYVLNIDRVDLIISPAGVPTINAQLTLKDPDYANEYFTLKGEKSNDTSRIIKGGQGASFDFERLTFPLILRTWQPGDWFQPLGMKGKKKVSDFMIDSKIPLNLKRSVCVLESAGEVAWVVGHRVDERFKVTKSTDHIYSFHLTSNDKPI